MSRRIATSIAALGLCLMLAACGGNSDDNTKTVTVKQSNETYVLKIERDKARTYSPDLTVTDRAGKKSVTLGEAVKACNIPFTEDAQVYRFTISAESKKDPSVYVDLGSSSFDQQSNHNLFDIMFLSSATQNCTGNTLLHKSKGGPMQADGYVIMMSGDYASTMLTVTAKSGPTSAPDTLQSHLRLQCRIAQHGHHHPAVPAVDRRVGAGSTQELRPPAHENLKLYSKHYTIFSEPYTSAPREALSCIAKCSAA